MTYFLIVIDLYKGDNTREKTEEKRRLTVERLLSSEEEAELGVAFLMLSNNYSIYCLLNYIIVSKIYYARE